MNPIKRSVPILTMCLLSFASNAAFTSSDMPDKKEPEHPTTTTVHPHVRVFPEPCVDECTLIIPDGLRGHTWATFLDGSYRTVRDRPLGFAETVGNRVDLPVSGLRPGTCTLRIWDGYGDAGATIIEHQ